MTGEKCYTLKKLFPIKIVQKKETNQPKSNSKRKAEKSKKIKKRGKMITAKYVSKIFVNVTMKRKDLYTLSNLERRF